MASCGSTSQQPVDGEDPSLFHPPGDLICPITQNLFVDPVVNSVGQIYERQAFLAYLDTSPEKIDPVTRQPLDEHVLTSIYAVKARASDYREETTKQCVRLASEKDAASAMIYLKRAAELCSEADMIVPGLGNETVSRILRQSSNPAYNTAILMSFAEDLMKDGQRDRAAAVYYALLKVGEGELTQQPDLLKCCIDCWTGRFCDGTDDKMSLQKLLEFVENQKAFTWGEIVDIMHHSSIDEQLILCLCEALLARDDPDPKLWKMQKEVMMKYIQMRCDAIQRDQGATHKDIQALMEWKERSNRTRGVKPRMAIPLAVLKEQRKPFFLKTKFIASVVIAFLELTSRGNIATKVSKATAIIYLINSQ